jgi:hypothetical protein
MAPALRMTRSIKEKLPIFFFFLYIYNFFLEFFSFGREEGSEAKVLSEKKTLEQAIPT